jgi:hypothetical protein
LGGKVKAADSGRGLRIMTMVAAAGGAGYEQPL